MRAQIVKGLGRYHLGSFCEPLSAGTGLELGNYPMEQLAQQDRDGPVAGGGRGSRGGGGGIRVAVCSEPSTLLPVPAGGCHQGQTDVAKEIKTEIKIYKAWRKIRYNYKGFMA